MLRGPLGVLELTVMEVAIIAGTTALEESCGVVVATAEHE
jgi:hypothetical protein